MIPGIGGRKPMEVKKSFLCQIIQPRMEELFEFALAEIKRSGYDSKLGAGVVVTGGTTLLDGTEELAREVFDMPVKVGIPTGLSYSGLAPEVESPIYSTVVGLALWGIGNIDEYEVQEEFDIKEVDKEVVISENEDNDTENQNTKPLNKKNDKGILTIGKKLKKFIEEL